MLGASAYRTSHSGRSTPIAIGFALIVIGTLLMSSDSKCQSITQGARTEFPIEIVPSTLPAGTRPVFTPDGQFMAVGGGNGGALYDVEKKRRVRTFTGLTSINSAIAISRDGRKVAAGAGSKVLVWDLISGQIESTLDLPLSIVNAIQFSHDGRRIIYAGSAKSSNATPSMIIQELGTGRIVKAYIGRYDVQALDVSPDGRIIAIGDMSGVVRLFNSDGRALRTLDGHKSGERVSRVDALSFSPDGKLLASGGNDRAAKIWDVMGGRLLRSLTGHEGDLHMVFSVSWSPDGNMLATTDNKSLRIWNAATGVLISNTARFEGMPGDRAYVQVARYLPTGNSLVVDAVGLQQLDAKTLRPIGPPFGQGGSAELIPGVHSMGHEVMISNGGLHSVDILNGSSRRNHRRQRTCRELVWL